jgi:hypothetical protein
MAKPRLRSVCVYCGSPCRFWPACFYCRDLPKLDPYYNEARAGAVREKA